MKPILDLKRSYEQMAESTKTRETEKKDFGYSRKYFVYTVLTRTVTLHIYSSNKSSNFTNIILLFENYYITTINKNMKKTEMKDIVNLAQNRGFVYAGSEIYG